MELHYIHEFCVLAETGNFLDAADELDIAQSTLSRHLQSLEIELGSPLFIRTTRRVKISDFGKALLPYAKKMLEIEESIHNDFVQMRRSTKNILTIGSVPVMTQYGITSMLIGFQKENPLYTFEITESESADLKEKLRDGTLNFAFVRELDISKHEFVSLPYTSDKLAAILPVAHPLAGAGSISLRQLRKENFLLLPEDTLMYKLCIDSCKSAGFIPKISYTSYRADNIVDLVAKGMGVTLLNKHAATPLLTPGTVIVDIVPSIETKIDLIYLKDRTMSYACKSFLNFVKTQIQTPPD